MFTLEIHTPYRLFFSDEVQSLTVLLEDGEIGICTGHAPFTAPVCTGILKIKDKNGNRKEAFTTEGIVEVKNKTILMVEAAEWPEEIDEARALAAKHDAEETLKTRILKFETAAAKSKLKRAETRLKVRGRAGPA
ncbi:MAG: ATP synthase F1 subunit epsilon [Spirochaetales bacterium]|jgi:F-type H+-transporting ATPase subunit epsilon|nr:ATP synthase F1 subunit epsilon [Spirochaetales bacterium]